MDKKLELMRHSLAHVLAMAVSELYPGVKLGMGPATSDGFYYDFDLGKKKISRDNLERIEDKMREIVGRNLKFRKEEMSIAAALKKEKNLYKKEIINDLKKEGEKKVTYYSLNGFYDLCKGPHVSSTGKLLGDTFRLVKVSGAYWKGDEKRKMLTRIYGVAFNTGKELREYLKMLEQARERDHRKLGKELDLFVSSKLVGKGLPLLTPKGAVIRQELEKFIIEEEDKRGYLRTYTPELARVELYKKSGHWDHYQESMYPAINVDGEDYVLRPMTCPHQFMIYNSRPRSYRELPLKYAEIARLFRKEQSGELSGLIRVMSFSLADAHIICRPDQLEKELRDVLDLVQYTMKTLGIKDYWYRFSTWDPKDRKKYINNPRAWRESTRMMRRVIKSMKLKFEEAEGEAAFYGPKLDVQLRNVNGKEDTAFTVQVDFALPERFEMEYVDKDGSKKAPMIIHRSSIGCVERTMAFLIEQYAGALPVWLSPVQVKILSVAGKHAKHCRKLGEELRKERIRIEVDDSNETVGKKIRNALREKVPYILVAGDKEIKSGKLAVRDRDGEKIRNVSQKKFIEEVLDKIKERK